MGQKAPRKVTSHLTKFLMVLTRPQKKHFLIYLTGLIWLIKFHSTREIAAQFAKKTPDNLQRFLNGSKKKVGQLQKASQKLVEEYTDTSRETLVVIDDTTCARDGKRIQGLGFHHAGSGLVKGQCAVTCILRTGARWLGWAIRGYQPKSSCTQATFKSKIEIAREILIELRSYLNTQVTILMDSWYTCAPILKLIQEAEWTFVAAIKKNRILEIDGRKTVVSHLAKGPRTYKTVTISKKRKLRVAKRVVHLPKIGTVLLFITKGGAQETRFLITNNLGMREDEMVLLYRERFGIEIFHKTIKQHLAFGHMFMRSWQGVQTHWTLVMIAYNLITLSAPKHCTSFRQKIRHFRSSVDHKGWFDVPFV